QVVDVNSALADRQQFSLAQLAQNPVDVDGRQPECVRQHELGEWALELGFCGKSDQTQPFGQFHEQMSGTLDGARRPILTRCSTTMASSREAAHMSAAPRRGNSVVHLTICVPSTGLTAASVKAENE